jgi:CBS domain-containing protein/sporulation protein YlmC with PRC-barrel domain
MEPIDATIGEVMEEPRATVTPDTPVATIKRRMEGETLRSLIVAEGDRPVGVVRWRDVSLVSGGERIAADVMTVEVPLVRPGTPLATAREHIHDVDLDLVPIVDENGRLIGEVHRARIVLREAESAVADAPAATTAGEDVEPVIHVERGMRVIDVRGDKVGTVDEVIQDESGRITHLIVKQGTLIKHGKRLPIDLVSGVQAGQVTLTITDDDVKRLPER